MEFIEYRSNTDQIKIVMKYKPGVPLTEAQAAGIQDAFDELALKVKEITAPEVKRSSRRTKPKEE